MSEVIELFPESALNDIKELLDGHPDWTVIRPEDRAQILDTLFKGEEVPPDKLAQKVGGHTHNLLWMHNNKVVDRQWVRFGPAASPSGKAPPPWNNTQMPSTVEQHAMPPPWNNMQMPSAAGDRLLMYVQYHSKVERISEDETADVFCLSYLLGEKGYRTPWELVSKP